MTVSSFPLTRSVSELSVHWSGKQGQGRYRSLSASRADQIPQIPPNLITGTHVTATGTLNLRSGRPVDSPNQITKIPQPAENQPLKTDRTFANIDCGIISDNQIPQELHNTPALAEPLVDQWISDVFSISPTPMNYGNSTSESVLNVLNNKRSLQRPTLIKTQSLTMIRHESINLARSGRHIDLSNIALLPEAGPHHEPPSFGSTSSIDTLSLLLEDLSAGHELDKHQLMADDILMIVFKRWFRHAAVSTAAADVAAYCGHPGAGGVFIITMSLAGIVDALYKCGEKYSQEDTASKSAAYFPRACEMVFSGLHKTRSYVPESLPLLFNKSYYQCSFMAAGCTIPADILSHAHDAGYLKSKVTPSVICPLIIILPTALASFATIKKFLITSRSQENELLGILDTIKTVFKRMTVHAAAGTVGADITVYLGHPALGMFILLAMGLAGLIDGFTQCGERLEKEPGNHELNGVFQVLCRQLHTLSCLLETKVPAYLQKLFYKAYLYSSVTGTAGTIIADILAHLNTSSSVLFAKVCPITIGSLIAMGSLSSIVSEINKNTVNPATNPDHFLIRDDPPNII